MPTVFEERVADRSNLLRSCKTPPQTTHHNHHHASPQQPLVAIAHTPYDYTSEGTRTHGRTDARATHARTHAHQ